MAVAGPNDHRTAKGDKMKKGFLIALLISTVSIGYAGSYDKVKITPDVSYLYVYHRGKAVKVHRIQDTQHVLTGEYAKTYRPKQYIQPVKLMDGIQTVGEVEVIQFMKKKVNSKEGMIIDVRDRKRYKKESIPSAVNIPVAIRNKPQAMEKIFKSLGMKKKADGSWKTDDAMDLIVYCDGLWCKKSSEMIHAFIAQGYPKEKIFYYRGGFQMWKILGFTTVKN